MNQYSKLIFEISKSSSGKFVNNNINTGVNDLPEELKRQHTGLPEISEIQTIRHFTNLSNKNFGIDTGFYPLGSCTMKYNPKINEDAANLDSFIFQHPYQDNDEIQGSLKLMYELGEFLKTISGMKGVSLIPAAGAHGESTGIKLISAYHKKKGNKRKNIIIPDTAHGTNPASSSAAGYNVISVSSSNGVLKASDIKDLIDDDTAALMLTNPNTLGFFESDIDQIAEILHEKDALLYCDGANTNAWMGQCRLGDMGVDVIQFNLHKTFSTPHGGGGPGAGPVVVSQKLVPFLPAPVITYSNNKYFFDSDRPDSIGRIKTYYGNFSVFIKAYTYILMLGKEGIKKTSEIAVLNANYIKSRLKNFYELPIKGDNMHEVVFSDKIQNQYGVKTTDIAKRLLDYGIHPPTIYFPLVIHGAIMIEPTETESKEELDNFCDVMIKISHEARENPDLLKNAPYNTPVRRCNEVEAAKKPTLCFLT